MALSESLQQQAVRELGETKCQSCGGLKDRNQSFCQSCYFALPHKMRVALYKTLSEGYASAYDQAKDWLKAR